MRFNRLLFLLILIFFVSVIAEANFRVRVKFGEIPNLTYQLDCVGDLEMQCSRQNLGDLWTREFLKTDEDRRMLKEWARLRDLYSKDVQLSTDPDANSSINLFDKIRIAGFQAASVEDYAARLDLLTAPADRSAFERVLRYFQPGFNVWWQKEAMKSGDGFAKQTAVLINSSEISAAVRQFYNFYAHDLPANYEISFNLLYVPNSVADEPSGGQQLQNYSLMEFKPKEKPEQRIDVAVHELCHFFYDNMKPGNRAELERKFFAANRASAIPAYNLINEALATAFGNGIIARSVTPTAQFEKYAARKNSFYNNDAIDRAAKAILPMLDEQLKNKRTINDAGFVNDYISALEKAFGEDLLRPKLYLSEMFLFMDDKYSVSIRRDARRILETASFYASEGSWTDENILDDYETRPRLNSVFIVHPDNIEQLSENKIISEAQAKQIQNEYDAKRQVLFSTERAPFTYVYIVVAENSDTAKKIIEKLANAKQFRGIYKG
jgi:hypothetical protein